MILASPLTLIMSPSNEESKEDFPDPTIPTMATKDPWGTCQVTFRRVESCNCWFGLSCQEKDAFLSSIGCFLLSSWSIWKKKWSSVILGTFFVKSMLYLSQPLTNSSLRKNKNLIWVKLPKKKLTNQITRKRQLASSINYWPFSLI